VKINHRDTMASFYARSNIATQVIWGWGGSRFSQGSTFHFREAAKTTKFSLKFFVSRYVCAFLASLNPFAASRAAVEEIGGKLEVDYSALANALGTSWGQEKRVWGWSRSR